MQRKQHELGVEIDAGTERLLDAPLDTSRKRLACGVESLPLA